MSALKKLFGDTAIYGLSSILGRFLNWALFPLFVAVLEPGEYGIVTQLYAYVAVFMVILTYGMETSFFRFATENNDKRKSFSTAFISLSVSTLIFLLVIGFTRYPIARYLGDGTLPYYVLIMALILGLDVISAIPFSYLRAENRAKLFATLKLVNIAVNISSNLFFLLLCPFLIEKYQIAWLDKIYFHNNKEAYIFISNLLASVVTLLMLVPYIRRNVHAFDKRLLNKMLEYGLPIMFVGLMGMLGLQSDKMLLPKLINDGSDPKASLGIYSAASKIAMILTMFTQAFKYAFEPFFFARGKDADRKIYVDTLNFFVIAGLLAFLGVLLYQDQIKLIIPEQYWSGLSIVPFILMGNLFLGVYYVLSVWYKLTDNTIFGAIISAAGAVSIIALNFILIPTIGMIGSAMAMMFGYGLMCILSYAIGQKHFPVDYKIQKAFIYLLVAILIYMLALFIRQQVQGTILLFAIHSLLLLIFLAFIAYTERNTINDLINKRKRNL